MSIGQTGQAASRKFSIKVDSLELERIIQARKNLDDVKALGIFALRYKTLGWSLVALEARNGSDLGVDFDQPQTTWLKGLMDLALQGTRIRLAIRLELDSPLFVLRVQPALGWALLDRLENWRSSCIARAGNLWEHHFLMLPKSWCLSPEHLPGDKEAPLSVMGPGSLVTVPPSLESDSQELWHWLSPPWKHAPCHPAPELLTILEECGFISRKSLRVKEDLPSWKEIYPLICHSDKLLQALLAPEENNVLYYRKILYEAVRAGFRDPVLLQSLLWHAPHSEVRFDPEGRQKLAQWTAEIEGLLATEPASPDRGAADWGSCDRPTGIAESEDAPAASLLWERPESATPPSSQDLVNELQFLAAETLELEEQLDELEGLNVMPEIDAECSPRPSHHEERTPSDPTLEENLGELEELRQAVEEFLAAIHDLPNSE